MILIIDNNEERRTTLVIRLRVKGYLACGIDYRNIEYYTKPFMTVYINPSRNIVEDLKKEDTINVIFTDRTNGGFPQWCINIFNLKNIENDILDIYTDNCNYMIKDKIDIVGYACLKNGKFALGGKIIDISTTQFSIISLFIFNRNKRFKLYEASQYMYFKTDAEESFERQIVKINKKIKEEGRDKLILNEGEWYFLNPDIVSYICQDYEIYENDEKFFFRYKLTD